MSFASSSAALPLFVVDVQFGLLVLVVLAVGVVSYTIYRDAEARGMDHAAYWGAAVGVLFVLGFVVGGLLAVGVYVTVRPDEIDEPLIPKRDGDSEDAAEATAEPSHDLTPARVQAASDTAVRGYARQIEGVDPTADPTDIRAQLLALSRDDTDGVGRDGTDGGSAADADGSEDGSFLDAVTEQDLDGTATVETEADRGDLDAVATVSDESDDADSPDGSDSSTDPEADADESGTAPADRPEIDTGADNFDGRGELHDGDPSMPSDDPASESGGEDGGESGGEDEN